MARMQSAKKALAAIADLVSEYDSFAEGFDHSDHGDDEDDDRCRFEMDGAPFEVLDRLITAAEYVLAADESETKFELDEALDALSLALIGYNRRDES